MTRLIWKEIRASVWIIALAASFLTLQVIIRKDALWLRSVSINPSLFAIASFPLLLMGLKSYSDELAYDTVGFLFSRPVQWWKIWLSKLLSGVATCACLTVFAAMLYVFLLPALYKPLFSIGLLQGMAYLFAMFLVAYTVGFLVSILVPGIALSFAALIGTYVFFCTLMLAVWGWLQIDLFDSMHKPFILATVLLGILASNILIAREISKFKLVTRLLTWATFIMASVAICTALMAAGIGAEKHCSPRYSAKNLSPNGRWAAYEMQSSDGKYILVDTRTGKTIYRWLGYYDVDGWSPDSGNYAVASMYRREVQIISMVNGKPRTIVVGFPEVFREAGYMFWSHDGKQLTIMPSNKKGFVSKRSTDGKHFVTRPLTPYGKQLVITLSTPPGQSGVSTADVRLVRIVRK